MSIKISEIFYSVQGEGKFTGVPSVFMRTFGCNFRCQGFGMPAGQKTSIVSTIDPKQFTRYQDLPLVSEGCDSYPAVYPQFKNLSPLKTIDQIANDIVELLPNKTWNREHLIITGGEPLLVGWQKKYPELLNHKAMNNLLEVTFETNGTQVIGPDLKDALLSTTKKITFSVSPKLSCSGEAKADAIVTSVVASYQDLGDVYLKFVVANENDVDESLAAIEEYRDGGFTGEVYLMPVGGVESKYNLNRRAVADLALKHGLRFSDRLQVSLYKNDWGT